jgi:hypothetical protein
MTNKKLDKLFDKEVRSLIMIEDKDILTTMKLVFEIGYSLGRLQAGEDIIERLSKQTGKSLTKASSSPSSKKG